MSEEDSINVNHNDLGLGPTPMPMGIQWCTAGWTSEAGNGAADHADVGSTTNDGTTLVKITSYSGRTPGTPTTPGQAQGHQYLAQLLGPVFRIPMKGERVLVAFPTGMETNPGAAVIIGTLGGGSETKRNFAPGDTAITASGGGSAALIVKANGKVTLLATSDNTSDGKAIALTVGPAGFSFDSPYGLQRHDASGWRVTTKAGPSIRMGGINIPGISSLLGILPAGLAGAFSTYCTISAGIARVAGSSVYLGAGQVFQPVVTAPVDPMNPIPSPGAVTGKGIQTATVWSAP